MDVRITEKDGVRTITMSESGECAGSIVVVDNVVVIGGVPEKYRHQGRYQRMLRLLRASVPHYPGIRSSANPSLGAKRAYEAVGATQHSKGWWYL